MLNTVEKPEASATTGLLVSNALTLVTALILKWPLAFVLWPYWIQSIIIGWYARKRMLALKNFSTEGFTSNDQPVPENEKGKRSTASFFVLHYGFFHFGYWFFYWTWQNLIRSRMDSVLLFAGFPTHSHNAKPVASKWLPMRLENPILAR